jgi:putative ABC transport system permease protein
MMKIRAYYTRYSYNVQIAIEAIIANKVKSLLTALGIIFGVAAPGADQIGWCQ